MGRSSLNHDQLPNSASCKKFYLLFRDNWFYPQCACAAGPIAFLVDTVAINGRRKIRLSGPLKNVVNSLSIKNTVNITVYDGFHVCQRYSVVILQVECYSING